MSSPRGFSAIHITYRGLLSAIARETGADLPFVRRALRDMYLAVGRRWHRLIRPLHFQYGAAGKYGYMPRKRLYTKIKQEEYGHTKELVASGESEHATARASFQPTSKGVKVVMDGGNLTAGRETFERTVVAGVGFGAKLKRQRRVEPTQMERELTTVTLAENAELGALADRVGTHYFNRISGSHRVTIQ